MGSIGAGGVKYSEFPWDIYQAFFLQIFYNDKILIPFLLIPVCRGLSTTMKTNTFLSMALVGFAVLKTATMVYTSCGHNTCVCDDKGRFARCKPERGHTQLPYFPSLPSYIRPNILRDELLNLTRLHLKVLQFQNMNITFMEKGLFQSFRRLTSLEISNNIELPTYVLRDAFKNISPTLQTLDVTSNNLHFSLPDLFKYLKPTNLSKLVLASNPMKHFQGDVIKGLLLTTLDLSSSGLVVSRKLYPFVFKTTKSSPAFNQDKKSSKKFLHLFSELESC